MQYNLNDFFEPIQEINYIEIEKYKRIEHYIDALQALSKVCNLSFYIIDYYKKCFQFVSPNPLLLCGYSQEEVLTLGFDFYPKCIWKDDLQYFISLNRLIFDFYYQLPVNRRENATVSCNFRIKHKSNDIPLMVNQKLAPLLLTEDGNIWMSICMITHSIKNDIEDVHFFMQDDFSKYSLRKNKKGFEKVPRQTLSKKESEILKLLSSGLRLNEIAKRLSISPSTVKNHKTRIFKKLNIKTTQEAVFLFATEHGIFM